MDPEEYDPVNTPSGPMEFDGEEFEYKIPEDINDQNRKIMEIIPEYMRPWVTNKDIATWEGRSYITLYLRERGFSIQMIKNFVKPFYITHPRSDSYNNNWEHYEAVKTAELMFQRKDLKMPNFDKLWQLGLISYATVEQFGRFSSPAYR